MAEYKVIHPLDVFPELAWKKIFRKVRCPQEIENICATSNYFNKLMVENGHHGVALFKSVYPLIRPYLDCEIDLLTRDYGSQPPNVFIERAENYRESLDKEVFGKLRQVCPFWRKVVWIDGLQRLKKKYKIHPYPPDYMTTPGFYRYLLLTPIPDGPLGTVMRQQTKKDVWHYARHMLFEAKKYNARYLLSGRYISSLAPKIQTMPLPEPTKTEDTEDIEDNEDNPEETESAACLADLDDLLKSEQVAILNMRNSKSAK